MKSDQTSEIEIQDFVGTMDDFRRKIGSGQFDTCAILALGRDADDNVHLRYAAVLLDDDDKTHQWVDSKPFHGMDGLRPQLRLDDIILPFAYVIRAQTDGINFGWVYDARMDSEEYRCAEFADLTCNLLVRRRNARNVRRAAQGLPSKTTIDEIFRKPILHGEFVEGWGLVEDSTVKNLRQPLFNDHGDRRPIKHIVLLEHARGAIGFRGDVICHVGLRNGKLADDTQWRYAGKLAKPVALASHQMGDTLIASLRVKRHEADLHQEINIRGVSADTPTSITVGPAQYGDGLLVGKSDGLEQVCLLFPRNRTAEGGRKVWAVGLKHDKAPPIVRALQLSA